MKLPNRSRFAPKARFLAVLAIAGLTLTASAKDAHGELQRKKDNTTRLGRMHPYMRPKVAAVLSDLEGHGYRPSIDPGVWRSPAEQATKVRKGYSKTLYSFHTATTRQGKPDSLAADIVDIRHQWKAGQGKYWLMLAASAESHDLTTGIYWGLSQAKRQAIHTAIAKRNFTARIPLGWDTAHVEPRGITVGQARRGLRPK